MADPKKKPGLALAVMVGTKKGPATKAEDDDDYSASTDELADVLGVPEAKRAAFREAFEAAVMSCK